MTSNARGAHRRTGAVILALSTLLAGAAGAAPAWTVSLEGGRVSSGYNDVQIPNDATGTRFSLSEELATDAAAYWRVRVTRALSARSSLSLLVAPLTLDVGGVGARDIAFAGETFAAGTALTGRYRFDSYRLTYRYDDHVSPRLVFGYGVTAKLRDASIELDGGGRRAVKDNTGFVPLVNLRARWLVAPRWSLLAHADALAAPQGRAEDVLLALGFAPRENVELQMGYRLLEGGADVDEVYTFALLHYVMGGLTVRF